MRALTILPLAAAGIHGSAPLPPGDTVLTLQHGGLNRTAELHLPPGAAPSEGYPLIIDMHGQGGDMIGIKTSTGDSTMHCGGHAGCTFSDLADPRGYIVVYPQGANCGNGCSFNGGACCGDAAHKAHTDDVGFLRALVSLVSKNHKLNKARIFSTGFSNGGVMSWYLACNAPELLRAIAPSHGSFMQGHPEKLKCEGLEASPVSVLSFSGTQDSLQGEGVSAPGVKYWRERLGHKGTPTQSYHYASTTFSYTVAGTTNITTCVSTQGKCATHQYDKGTEIHTAVQTLDFFDKS